MNQLIVLILLSLGICQSVWSQPNRLKFRHLTVDNGLPQNSVFSIVKDSVGFMWFATWGGAVRYDGYRFQVFRASENDTLSLPDNRVGYIIVDSARQVWVQAGNYDFFYRFNYQTESFFRVPYRLVPKSVMNQVFPREGAQRPAVLNHRFHWLAEQDQLRQVDLQTGDQMVYRTSRSLPFELSDGTINTIFLDDQQNIWIGTHFGGVNMASLTPKRFGYEHASPNGHGLVDNVVRAVTVDGLGRMWVGTDNKGITIVEPSANGNRYLHVGAGHLRNRRIRSLYCDKQGDVWIGTKDGLFCYRSHLNQFVDCSQGLCELSVFAILEDSRLQLWVGTFFGLAIYNRELQQYHCLGPALTNGKQIRALLEDANQNLWVATEDGGLSRINQTFDDNGNVTFSSVHYPVTGNLIYSPINSRIFSLALDAEGMIWMATNAGVSRLNPDDGKFIHFTIKNGMPDDVTMGVLFDGQQWVWVSHKKGLTRIHTQSFDMQSFNLHDGLQGNEFNQNACFRHNLSGQLFFGGNNGLNFFSPDSIHVNPVPPSPVFTRLFIRGHEVKPGVKLDNRVVLPVALPCTDKLTFAWADNTFAIEFSALHYTNPLGNKYRYRLEGFDRHWQQTDAANRTASYSRLPWGRYRLVLYAANSDGVWCELPAVLNIRVLPPWWFSWWAWLLYVIVVIALGGLVWRMVMARMAVAQQEMLHKAKMRFFTDVSHEFRTPLTLLVDPLQQLIDGKIHSSMLSDVYAMMHRNANQLLLLVNQLLDFRKLEEGHSQLQFQVTDIVAFTKGIAASFETFARQRQIELVVSAPELPIAVMFDCTKMHMVLNNLFSNAFKYTPNGGRITLQVQNTPEGVAIMVSDTGIGIAPEEQEKVFDLFYQSENQPAEYHGAGIGLALTNELVRLHGGRLSLSSSLGNGSCFTVLLPVVADEVAKVSECVCSECVSIAEALPVGDNCADAPLLLVVDDNEDIRRYIQLAFQDRYRVVTAINGDDAFKQAVALIPDLVITDVMMPGTDGLTLCGMLKADERTSHVPVIILTARQSVESQTEGYQTGADVYVVKPFNSEVLKAQVTNLLAQRQRLRQLFSQGTSIEFKKKKEIY
jgi:signal transduction histidine kinase/ligand-binding sensor domain-containing protein/ActR/RegA family two-component response regulator